MPKNLITNLDSVKDIALALLHTNIKETELAPMIISHPIFESGFLFNQKTQQIINILEDQDGLNDIIHQYEKLIMTKTSVKSIYFIIRKSYRLTFLKFIEKYLSIEDFSDLLSDAWTTSENPNQDINVSISYLTTMFQRTDKQILMTKEEYEIYLKLPTSFIIYRGVAVNRNPNGMSWTQDFQTAKWFSERFDYEDKKGYIQQGIANKKDVLAYFNRRGEDEIVINIKNIKDVQCIK